MAGFGTRLRPHTWSKPKPLIPLAGKTALDHVLDQFNHLPDPNNVEYIFIVSSQQGGLIRDHMEKCHPEKIVHYVNQTTMRGQSDALYQAREFLHGPMLMAFADTLTETDLSFLKDEQLDGVALVMPVDDPRRFGVAQLNEQGLITRLIEKPQEMNNKLALIGFYYFRSGESLIAAIEEQMKRKMTLKGEFFLADAINIMLEHGAKFRIEKISTWLDAGTTEAMFETNQHLLNNGHSYIPKGLVRPGVTVVPPVYIHENCQIENCVIGPNVSISANCKLKNVIIKNSIVDMDTELSNLILVDSLLGKFVQAHGRVAHLNMGDNSSCTM
jgi:glucose-1-phosphate thymidylyltransferase